MNIALKSLIYIKELVYPHCKIFLFVKDILGKITMTIYHTFMRE